MPCETRFISLAFCWLLRLLIAGLQAPQWMLRIASVTVTSSVCVMLAVLLIHVRQFGGYTNVVLASLLINLWSEGLIILAIVFSVLTGFENVFTRPEYLIGIDSPRHLRHIYGHLTFGVGLGTLSGSAVGCLLLWLLRSLIPLSKQKRQAVG